MKPNTAEPAKRATPQEEDSNTSQRSRRAGPVIFTDGKLPQFLDVPALNRERVEKIVEWKWKPSKKNSVLVEKIVENWEPSERKSESQFLDYSQDRILKVSIKGSTIIAVASTKGPFLYNSLEDPATFAADVSFLKKTLWKQDAETGNFDREGSEVRIITVGKAVEYDKPEHEEQVTKLVELTGVLGGKPEVEVYRRPSTTDDNRYAVWLAMEFCERSRELRFTLLDKGSVSARRILDVKNVDKMLLAKPPAVAASQGNGRNPLLEVMTGQ